MQLQKQNSINYIVNGLTLIKVFFCYGVKILFLMNLSLTTYLPLFNNYDWERILWKGCCCSTNFVPKWFFVYAFIFGLGLLWSYRVNLTYYWPEHRKTKCYYQLFTTNSSTRVVECSPTWAWTSIKWKRLAYSPSWMWQSLSVYRIAHPMLYRITHKFTETHFLLVYVYIDKKKSSLFMFVCMYVWIC